MKSVGCACTVGLAFLLASCSTAPKGTQANGRPTPPPTKAKSKAPANSVKADPSLSPLAGKIASINSQLRFVVLDFSLGGMPAPDQLLNAYRQGQRMAELRVSGPQMGTYIVADVIAGLVQVGDEVRPD
jgi:starvation-inducible outer membrane lipoprotein